MKHLILKKINIVAAVVFSFSATVALCLAPSLSESEKQIVLKLAQANLAEINMGELAERNSRSQAVKDLGKRMANDHSELQANLIKWATPKALTLPTQSTAADREEFDRLKEKKGGSFDRAYTDLMLKDHQKDIEELQSAAETTGNSDIKSLLTQTIPILENHVRATENVAGRIGVPAKKGMNQPIHPQGT